MTKQRSLVLIISIIVIVAVAIFIVVLINKSNNLYKEDSVQLNAREKQELVDRFAEINEKGLNEEVVVPLDITDEERQALVDQFVIDTTPETDTNDVEAGTETDSVPTFTPNPGTPEPVELLDYDREALQNILDQLQVVPE